MFLNKKLSRPLVFFDFETTDKDAKLAKIVEFAFLKVMLDGSELRLQGLVNPGCKIPEESTAVHGISDDAVAEKSVFAEYAHDIFEFIYDCDLAGYNSNKYDVPILIRELSDVGYALDVESIEIIDVRNAFVLKEPRTLSAAYKFYTGKDLDDAHSAMTDVVATKTILEEQFWRYKNDFPETIPELAVFTNHGMKMFDPTSTLYRDQDGIIRFMFGKHKDTPIAHVIQTDISYITWFLGAGFPANVLKIIRAHL